MNEDTKPSTSDEVQLRKLISLWIDGLIEQSDMQELADTLRQSEDARSIYLSMMGINAELHNMEDAKRYIDEMLVESVLEISDTNGQEKPRNLMGLGRRGLALAASLLFFLGVATLTKQPNNLDSSLREASDSSRIIPLEVTEGDSRWYVEHSSRMKPKEFYKDDIIRVISGTLELNYENGIKVFLKSPATYQLVSGMESRMYLGQLTAEVSEAGKGFSVKLPRATVIDLGTKFSVNVNDDGASDVVVFKGEVDVDYHEGIAGSIKSKVQRLQMGEAVRLDAIGTASRIVSINNTSYSARAEDGSARPIVISEVRDNIDRLSSLNYYEIVHEGMGEEALAFVDREAHQWNGIETSGMPAYLVGGDYVKTFNNDKFKQDIRVSVKVEVPSRLYILFDNRLPIPNWLKQGFRDTGDDIGMDIGRFFSNGKWHDRETNVGPGLSIEDTFSIWEKQVPNPEIVFLGSTEAPVSEPNMYGIVAVPTEVQ